MNQLLPNSFYKGANFSPLLYTLATSECPIGEHILMSICSPVTMFKPEEVAKSGQENQTRGYSC